MRGVLQGSNLGLVLFNIFVNDIDSRIEYALSKFSGNTKLSGSFDTIEGYHSKVLRKAWKIGPCEQNEVQQTKYKVMHKVGGNLLAAEERCKAVGAGPQ